MSLDRTHKRVCHLTTGILIPPWHFLSWQSNRDYVPTRESLNVKGMKVKQKHRKQKEKALGSPPKGLASYVTQHKCDSFFIWTHKLRMPSLPANSLQCQQSANHRLRRKKKNSRLLSEKPTGNEKHRPQLTYLFTPDYAGTLHTMQYGATSSGPCRGQQQRRAVSAVWVHLQLTATDGNSGFSIISHSKR